MTSYEVRISAELAGELGFLEARVEPDGYVTVPRHIYQIAQDAADKAATPKPFWESSN